MVPDLIWAQGNLVPKKFVPQEILAPRNLVPKKIGPRMKIIMRHFLGDQISWRRNFLGSKKVGGPNAIGDHLLDVWPKINILNIGISLNILNVDSWKKI